jgi:hypothetical protein
MILAQGAEKRLSEMPAQRFRLFLPIYALEAVQSIINIRVRFRATLLLPRLRNSTSLKFKRRRSRFQGS